MNWPTINNLPPQPTITVRFGGLLGFCYRTSGECEIGFNAGDGRHRIGVRILENGTEIYPNGGLPNIVTMKFGVESKNPSVKFLKLTADPFDRQTGPPQDFRWMLDLEGEDFYSEKPDKDLVFKFKARLLVTQGIFYTSGRTKSTFNRVSVLLGSGGISPYPLYYLASEIAAAIQLAETEVAFLEINGQKVKRLPGTAGKRYEVRFSNACEEPGGAICQWNPGSLLEGWRNDFHFHRKVFSLPLLRARYGLMLAQVGNLESADVEPEWKPFGTDRAPCMGVGYGETDGFP